MAAKKKKSLRVMKKKSLFERYPFLQLLIVSLVIISAVTGIVYNKTKRTVIPTITTLSVTPTPTVAPSIEAATLETPPLYPEISWTQADAKNLLHYGGVNNGRPYGGDISVSGTKWTGRLPYDKVDVSVVSDYYSQELLNRGWTHALSIDGLTLGFRQIATGALCSHGTVPFLGFQDNDLRLIIVSADADPCGEHFISPIPDFTIVYSVFISDPISLSVVQETAEKSR